jgi:hypothetical protein
MHLQRIVHEAKLEVMVATIMTILVANILAVQEQMASGT